MVKLTGNFVNSLKKEIIMSILNLNPEEIKIEAYCLKIDIKSVENFLHV